VYFITQYVIYDQGFTVTTPPVNVSFANENVTIGGVLIIPKGAATNYVLKTDASGNTSWEALSGVSVTSISNTDGTLTISPTTGAAVASIALGHANTWTARQTLDLIGAPTGAAGIVGSSTLVAGTVTVSTTAVTASSVILLSVKTIGGTAGTLSVGTVTAGTSFVINSSSSTDTSTVNWLIIN
jgi:hypothetical protein